ncbi:heme ABC transporter ATP-binding protein CcmA [Erwinia sp. OLTSP20]|uniref:cytochrome c biogenesis heme-transporting ATPase CcmA n=1 Tax=unclassified Erwinia TaxID=2622719 RepID=UPI000C17A108|nr:MULTISPECIES: cytochrome c biogenesis heme-transporting ATPase CcmA [unclassified Erwinia]PIJ51538.1 heme ABC transporter ATP-binding protein CcmA [Erwinia sp. OAMSP11]PIJ75876.1 heme ABC transporter ATP-binding protein CcmA [Erwinia sp. OLSSP12]PIJ83448.1 heme ABC transporter ATP-binding protein CcmA [Erwinia sp. OLCASP19]PIJ86281.1 heme ABC transporter ATP-binding protein CcmA [Erwinia sp. OLMTSP26]PIJ88476.1 heme ABC transporter ATP-binding protein CcmA [Erwinia sp. OLMDSP33]
MLEARSLTCVRGERTLFSQLSFTVNPGDILQIEGVNGAGKTSLLRILAGLHRSEQGHVCWDGQDILQQREAFHRQLLFLGHRPGVKALLTPLENLRFYHHDRPEQAVWDALESAGLLGYEDVAISALSAGQQRRVALARLWLSQASVWILDEPLTAIDKAGVSFLMQRLVEHVSLGGMVVLTTHQDLPQQGYPLRKIRLLAAETV